MFDTAPGPDAIFILPRFSLQPDHRLASSVAGATDLTLSQQELAGAAVHHAGIVLTQGGTNDNTQEQYVQTSQQIPFADVNRPVDADEVPELETVTTPKSSISPMQGLKIDRNKKIKFRKIWYNSAEF
jgi:hypothetical protein